MRINLTWLSNSSKDRGFRFSHFISCLEKVIRDGAGDYYKIVMNSVLGDFLDMYYATRDGEQVYISVESTETTIPPPQTHLYQSVARGEAEMKLLVKEIGQLVTVCEGKRFLAGRDMANITVRKGPLALAVDDQGKIAMVGREEEVTGRFAESSFSRVISAGGCAVLPGFVDGHTHPVWAGDRVHEFAMKLAGATYMEVHAAGGGIHYTVDHGIISLSNSHLFLSIFLYI